MVSRRSKLKIALPVLVLFLIAYGLLAYIAVPLMWIHYEHQKGLDYLRRAVAKGYFVTRTLSASRQFDALRSDPVFVDLSRDAEAGRQQALAAFRAAGGERLLGA